LDLKALLEGTSHYQTTQKALQLLQKGFKAGCSLERQRKRTAKDGGKGGKGG